MARKLKIPGEEQKQLLTENTWSACMDPMEMLNCLQANKVNRTKHGRRKLRLFSCSCSRRVWGLMTDRGRSWLDLGERCADGLLNVDQRRQVLAEVNPLWLHGIFPPDEASPDLRGDALRAARAAYWAGLATLMSNVMTAAEVSAHNAAMAMGINAVQRRRSGGEHAAEQREQVALLQDIFGNPFVSVVIDSAWIMWNDGIIPRLAQVAYEQRSLPNGHLDLHRLAVLADALEEAGANTALLDHLRGPGPHVRGCWPVDLLLSKR
jgi:hypothetical protein